MNNPTPPPAPAGSLATIHCLLLLTLLLSACGRRPTEPTPLPPGTPLAQPTPDFSAPAQPATATRTADQTAQSLRTRLAQQRAQEPSLTPSPSPLTPAVSPEVTPAVPLDPSLSVFNRPNALGILAGGGILYAAPGGAARANLQVGATLTLTGRSADSVWFAAYLADGTAGWVPAAQVRVFGDAAELEVVQESLGPAIVATLIAQASQPQTPIVLTAGAPTPAVSPAVPPAVITVIVEGANLRAGPGTDFPVVGGLYQDATAALLGRDETGDWLQLQLPDGPAWIFAPLVETTVPIADLPTIEPPPSP